MTNTLDVYNRLFEAYLHSYRTNLTEDFARHLEEEQGKTEEEVRTSLLTFFVGRGDRAILHAIAEEFSRMSHKEP